MPRQHRDDPVRFAEFVRTQYHGFVAVGRHLDIVPDVAKAQRRNAHPTPRREPAPPPAHSSGARPPVIPADRLTKKYFRKWFYWHGISRAILYKTKGLDMESPESTALDFSTVPHIAGIPRYMFRTYLKSLFSMVSAFVRTDEAAAFEHELGLWFFAGVIKERWKDRRQPIPERRSLVTLQDN